MNLPDSLTIEDVEHLLQQNEIGLSSEAKKRIEECHTYLLKKVENESAPIYGVNTGFGSLYDKEVSRDKLTELQVNLLRSHACGTGDFVPKEIVKTMLLLKAMSLSYGHSGVQLQTVEKILDLYNNNVLPVVYELGSLGASGDLAPLSHLCLPLIGEGEVWSGTDVSEAPKSNHQLGPKEGLALINGTQFMQAYGIHCLLRAKTILERADKLAAMAIDAYDGRIEPFLEYSHKIRPHQGQLETAKAVLGYLEGSEIVKQPKKHVQDPYSFRCVPQVHGATKDVYRNVKQVFETEINSVTDNPNIFPEEDLILSAGNFHGQPLALHLDFLAIALAEIGSISERRLYRLVEGNRGLPPFLTSNPGLESGLMIAQYTAASIVSQNKQLCTPAVVDTIDSSNGQEDHVSMGANAATKCLKVVENVERIQAIELLTTARAMQFRRPLKSSPQIEDFLAEVENVADLSQGDRIWSVEINKLVRFIRKYSKVYPEVKLD
jgi:histidine ammonia-lyase